MNANYIYFYIYKIQHMEIKPIGNRALIQLSKSQLTKSGIIISQTEKTEQTIGIVKAIGIGFDAEDGNINNLGIKIGDKVVINKYGGESINDDENEIEYKVVNAKDILAIIS
jgi:chaperonin GroES